MAEVAVAVNKMGKKIIIIGCVIAVVMIVGCQDYGNKHYYHELEKIEHRQNRELARRENRSYSIYHKISIFLFT